MMDFYTTTNIAVSAACTLLLIIYHLWLASVIRRNPEKTVYGLSAHSRKAWVAAIMKGHKDILAVQSLRNLIMASSILASTCVAIIFGFIAFLATVVSHPESVDSNGNPMGSQFGFVLDHLFGVKVMMLLVVFCVAFFCFAQSMRFYNHVGLVININLSQEELEDCLNLNPIDNDTECGGGGASCMESIDADLGSTATLPSGLGHRLTARASSPASFTFKESTSAGAQIHQQNNRMGSPERTSLAMHRRERHLNVHHLASRIEFVAQMLNRGSMFYTLGMRGYYISFPVMAFLWGPWALLGTTVLLVGILRVVDFNLEALSPVNYRESKESRESSDAHRKSSVLVC